MLFQKFRTSRNKLAGATDKIEAQSDLNQDILNRLVIIEKKNTATMKVSEQEFKKVNKTFDKLATEIETLGTAAGQLLLIFFPKIDLDDYKSNAQRIKSLCPRYNGGGGLQTFPLACVEGFDWSNLDKPKDSSGQTGPFSLVQNTYDSLKNPGEAIQLQC